MEIKCWGSRGSIPVSGKQYLKYGGDTTCIEITAKSGESVIVDAGTGIRPLGNSFIERKISEYTLLFTHVHWDHILGFSFFRPLLHSTARIAIQDRKFSGMATREVLGKVMQPPFFPISLNDLNADIQFDSGLNDSFSIGSIDVETIPTSHTGGGLGYRFTEEGKSFVFLTDNELGYDHPESRGFDAYRKFAQDADLLIHDGEYTQDEYKRRVSWGHSSVEDVLDLSLKANVKKVGIFHINQDRADDEMDQIIGKCVRDLKQQNASLDCFAVPCRYSIRL